MRVDGLTAATPSGRAGLAAIVADPGSALLALDFDGVLAPIVADPESSRVHPDAMSALVRVAPLVGSMAVISGRPAAVVVSYGGFAGVPELADLVVFGHYGRERWDARTARVESPPPPPGVEAVRRELPELLARLPLPVGVTVEDKGSAVAVHTRRCADPIGALQILREALPDLASRHGLHVEPGRMVVELRPPGVDKGAALRAYVTERQARSVMYIGDDLGDLSAFAAVDALGEQGIAGVKVCSGSAEVVELAERADVVVDGPPGVAAFLDALADALARGAAGRG